MYRKSPAISRQMPLFAPDEHELRIELTGEEQRELIRALAQLLLQAARHARASTTKGEPDDG